MNDLKFTTAGDYMQSTDLLLKFAKKAGLKSSSECHISTAEKDFADLIITECSKLLHDTGMVEVAIDFKQHFGLK